MGLWGHVISIFSVSNAVSSLTRLCKIIWSKPSEFPLIRTSPTLTLFPCTPSLSLLAHHTLLGHKPKDMKSQGDSRDAKRCWKSSCKDDNLPCFFLGGGMSIASFGCLWFSSSALRQVWEQGREKIMKAYKGWRGSASDWNNPRFNGGGL